jgi:hypothetical protein
MHIITYIQLLDIHLTTFMHLNLMTGRYVQLLVKLINIIAFYQ